MLVGIRFALFADLLLLAGLAAFPLYALNGDERRRPAFMAAIRRIALGLCLAGLLLSAWGIAVLFASMLGVGLLELDPLGFWELVRETDVGTAWIYRSIALLIALGAAWFTPRWPTMAPAILNIAAAAAIITLVWSGHAGATEGAAGSLHRISDMLHMLAAAIWIGAIAAFLILLSRRIIHQWPDAVSIAARCLDRFSLVGTLCVVIIAVTGLINSQMIVGIDNVAQAMKAPYGQLLLLKLALFLAMLGLAAANRWRLTPALTRAAAISADQASEALIAPPIAALRKSLMVEILFGVIILALVAWLGTLEPLGSIDLG